MTLGAHHQQIFAVKCYRILHYWSVMSSLLHASDWPKLCIADLQVFFHAEAGDKKAQNACSGTHMLLWLPHFHDFCLTVGILGCGMKGYPIVLMSPLHFIAKPTRWLDFMSRYKTSHTVGPDFAFGLLSR